MTTKVPFQKSRIFLLGIKCAWLAGIYKNKDPNKSQAYKILVSFCEFALMAAANKRQSEFIQALDLVEKTNDNELQAMLDGVHPDTPQWLKK